MIEQLVTDHLNNKNFEVVSRWNTLCGEWSDQGWPMALPDPEWSDRTRVVLHFQDRITPTPTGCRELEAIEQHYGKRANQVVVVFYTRGLDKIYSGPVQLVEFSSHNWLTITDILRIQEQWHDKFDQPKTRPWQCLNGRQCPHRVQVARHLESWPNGMLSLGTDIKLPLWDYGTYRGTENYDNFIRLISVYQQCAVNIVTETDYNARPGVISEKTLYAFVTGQVPVLIAHPGAVQDCRDMGFDMFDDVVNNSFDYLPNEQRALAALDLNQDLILGQKNLAGLQQRLQQNRKYAVSGFLDWMTATAKQDLSKVF